jgi:hypothetical protein
MQYYKLKTPGVYGLLYRGDVVYIGQSGDVMQRISQHKMFMRYPHLAAKQKHKAKSMRFDGYWITEVVGGKSERRLVEDRLIAEHQPRYNTRGLQPTCSVVGCEAATIANGKCTVHYDHERKHGNALGRQVSCVTCGEEFFKFAVAGKGEMCGDCEVGHCVICSRFFQRRSNNKQQATCSHACAAERRKTWNMNSQMRPDDVLAIRGDDRIYREIALDYGVGEDQIGLIKRRRSWGHI